MLEYNICVVTCMGSCKYMSIQFLSITLKSY